MPLWEKAVGAGGVGIAVAGIYVYWRLMRRLGPKPGDKPLGPRQRMRLEILCVKASLMGLVATLTAGCLVCYLLRDEKPTASAESSAGPVVLHVFKPGHKLELDRSRDHVEQPSPSTEKVLAQSMEMTSIGHVDPSIDGAVRRLLAMNQSDAKAELEKDQADLQKEAEQFEKKAAIMSEGVKAAKQAHLQNRILRFQQVVTASR